MNGNACVVVDAETQDDLNHFAADLLRAANAGKRFLFRSAASLLTALARLPPQPVPAAEMAKYVRGGKPGAVIVGSHVPKTTRQLKELLKLPGIAPIEVDVRRLPQEHAALLVEVLARAEAIHVAGQTPVIFTSRTERAFPDQTARLAFGEQVSGFLMDVVRGLPKTLGFLVSKGGITSNDVLSSGLALRTSRLLGQILPGVSVVRCPPDHARFQTCRWWSSRAMSATTTRSPRFIDAAPVRSLGSPARDARETPVTLAVSHADRVLPIPSATPPPGREADAFILRACALRLLQRQLGTYRLLG